MKKLHNVYYLLQKKQPILIFLQKLTLYDINICKILPLNGFR